MPDTAETIEKGFRRLSQDIKRYTDTVIRGSQRITSDVKHVGSVTEGAHKSFMSSVVAPPMRVIGRAFSREFNTPPFWLKDLVYQAGREPLDMTRAQARYYAGRHWRQRGDQLKHSFFTDILPLVGLFGGMPTYLAAEAAGSIFGGRDAKETWAWRNLMDKTGQSFITSGYSNNTVTGTGWSEAEQASLSRFHYDFAKENKIFNAESQRQIQEFATNIGYFDKTTNMDEYKRKYKDLISGTKEVMQTLHQSMEEALKTMGYISKLGVSDVSGTIKDIGVAAAATGMSSAQVLQFAGGVSGALYQKGFSKEYGADVGLNAATAGAKEHRAGITATHMSNPKLMAAFFDENMNFKQETWDKFAAGEYDPLDIITQGIESAAGFQSAGKWSTFKKEYTERVEDNIPSNTPAFIAYDFAKKTYPYRDILGKEESINRYLKTVPVDQQDDVRAILEGTNVEQQINRNRGKVQADVEPMSLLERWFSKETASELENVWYQLQHPVTFMKSDYRLWMEGMGIDLPKPGDEEFDEQLRYEKIAERESETKEIRNITGINVAGSDLSNLLRLMIGEPRDKESIAKKAIDISDTTKSVAKAIDDKRFMVDTKLLKQMKKKIGNVGEGKLQYWVKDFMALRKKYASKATNPEVAERIANQTMAKYLSQQDVEYEDLNVIDLLSKDEVIKSSDEYKKELEFQRIMWVDALSRGSDTITAKKAHEHYIPKIKETQAWIDMLETGDMDWKQLSENLQDKGVVRGIANKLAAQTDIYLNEEDPNKSLIDLYQKASQDEGVDYDELETEEDYKDAVLNNTSGVISIKALEDIATQLYLQKKAMETMVDKLEELN